jgi:hypothetical protein
MVAMTSSSFAGLMNSLFVLFRIRADP